MKRVTIDQVMSWEPCEDYTRKRVAKLFAGRKTVSATNVLGMDIPDEDKLWAVLRPELIPEPTLHEWACRVAHKCLTDREKEGHKIDRRSWAAIRAKRRWMKGEITDEQLDSADSAAYSAAYSADSAADSAARTEQVDMVREILEEVGTS
jgi:hypothetical protein